MNQLREQYKKLKQRNKQMQIIVQSSNEKQQQMNTIEPANAISNGPLVNFLSLFFV